MTRLEYAKLFETVFLYCGPTTRLVFESSDLGTPDGSVWQAEFSRVSWRDFLQVLWTADVNGFPARHSPG